MADTAWDKAWFNPFAPPIFAPPPQVLPLPSGPTWGTAPPIFAPVNNAPPPAPPSLPDWIKPFVALPLMAASAAKATDGSDAAATPQAAIAAAPAAAAVDQAALAPQPISPGSPVNGRHGDWSDADRARIAGIMDDDFSRRLLGKHPDLSSPPTYPSFGELKPAQYAPTERVGNAVADGLTALGMQPYTANDLTHRIGQALSLYPPIGIASSAADTPYALANHDLVGTVLGMAGILPGLGPEARAGSNEIRSAINAARENAAAAAENIGSALKAEAPAAAVAGKTDPAVKAGAGNATGAVTPNGKYYSVAFETKLNPASYPRVSRQRHYQEANEALLRAIESDPEFAKILQDNGLMIQRTPTGLAPRSPPAGWSWHHAEEPGVMQLVPTAQHTRGSIFQGVLHKPPYGAGGFSIWGK